jgi:hypothetical protein
LHSPRLLQIYLEQNELAQKLPAYRNVGRNYKFHVLTAMLAFSHRPVTDTLCKTMLLLNDAFPSSSVQTLGGNLAYEIVMTQFPQRVPGGFSMRFARRAYGFFLQTEDGSHPDNRIVAAANGSDYPGSITILTALPLRWPSTAGSLEPCNGNCCDSATLLSPSRFQSPARHTLAGPW